MPNIETSSLNIQVPRNTLDRILAAHQRDKTAQGSSLDEWITEIVLDWVEEVEKPEPVRDLGFGN